MYLLVFFGMVQRGLLITLLFCLEQNHSSACKSSPLTLPLTPACSAPLRLLLFSSSSCDTCSVIIKVIFYIWPRGKWQAANPATGAFISAFQLPYNLASAFAEMEGKSCSVSINHVSRKSEIWPVQERRPPAMRASLAQVFTCVSVWTRRTPLHVRLDDTGSQREKRCQVHAQSSQFISDISTVRPY